MHNFYEISSYIGTFLIVGISLYFFLVADKNENFEKYNSFLEKK